MTKGDDFPNFGRRALCGYIFDEAGHAADIAQVGESKVLRRRIPDRVDWWQIIVDCCRQGHTTTTIALSIGSSRQSVNDYKNNGSRIKFEEGDLLIDLWCSLTGKSRDSVPRLR